MLAIQCHSRFGVANRKVLSILGCRNNENELAGGSKAGVRSTLATGFCNWVLAASHGPLPRFSARVSVLNELGEASTWVWDACEG
jgi:hypothetical protein